MIKINNLFLNIRCPNVNFLNHEPTKNNGFKLQCDALCKVKYVQKVLEFKLCLP